MKIVVDTNVFVSGIYFSGPPSRILEAWRDRKLQLAMSPEILEEYDRVSAELHAQFRDVDPTPFLELLIVEAEWHLPPPLEEGVCVDPDDDKFLACAVAAAAPYVITGDRLLLNVVCYCDVAVVTPRWFVDHVLALRTRTKPG